MRNPQLATDIRAIVEPHTQADTEMKSERRYLNLTAAEVRQRLINEKNYADETLPAERTMRNILNRMNYPGGLLALHSREFQPLGEQPHMIG